jgi:GNAT superfamily N-acetyltransferase
VTHTTGAHAGPRARIRSLAQEDYPRAAQLLAGAPAPYAWGEAELADQLRQRLTFAFGAFAGAGLEGLLVYEARREGGDRACRSLRLLYVRPEGRRAGVGTQLLEACAVAGASGRPVRLLASVPEDYLDLQCFLRARGFSMAETPVIRNKFWVVDGGVRVPRDLYAFRRGGPPCPASAASGLVRPA